MMTLVCVAATTTPAGTTTTTAPTVAASTTATTSEGMAATSTTPTQATTHATTVATTAATTDATTAATTDVTTDATTAETTAATTASATGTTSGTMTANLTTSTTSDSTANITTPDSTGNISTASPTTGPLDGVKWHVRDKNNNLCMLMDFGGTISYNVQNVTVEIPDSGETSKSTCSSKESEFTLRFVASNAIWELSMSFFHAVDTYSMTAIVVSLYEINGRLITFSSSSENIEVPVGSYYSCNSFNASLVSFNVNLTKPHLQPFVGLTESRTTLGKEFVCGSNPHHGVIGINILIGIIIAIIIMSVAVGLTWYLVKRRNAGGPRYSSLT
ncbi:uncharacterized protein [Diadema antillarum]|uniref:uncharacterized protein n=1 Tax=Diadema antillarum TaxID=105358 RepID=UPI003A85E319